MPTTVELNDLTDHDRLVEIHTIVRGLPCEECQKRIGQAEKDIIGLRNLGGIIAAAGTALASFIGVVFGK